MAIRMEDVVKSDLGSIYKLVWDGWQGNLTLFRDGTGHLEIARGDHRRVRFQLAEPQDPVEGLTGPGFLGKPGALHHRVIFWVDFQRTDGQPGDDQRFDVYFFTQTLNAMAGVTWWDGIPFGFYATFSSHVLN